MATYTRSYPVASGPTSTNTVSSTTRNLGLTGKQAGTVIYDEGSKNTTPLTPRQNQLVYKTTPPTTTKKVDPVVPTNYGSGSGYTAQEAPSYSGGDGGYTPPQSNTDDILNKIRGLLEEQKVRADEYLKSQYNQALENYKNQERLDSEKANLRKLRLDRRMAEMYGNSITGPGLFSQIVSDSNWNNDIANIQRDLSNRNATALQDYNRGLANNASTLSQGWYNYILPIYTNRQQNLDDLDYRKYVNSLFNY